MCYVLVKIICLTCNYLIPSYIALLVHRFGSKRAAANWRSGLENVDAGTLAITQVSTQLI